jgi:energy-coupling factor transporter ATP-binding protein EcfA2
MLTTRFWRAATVLWCALLWQSCQTNSLRAIEEEAPAKTPLESGGQPPASETLTQPVGDLPSPPSTTATQQPPIPLIALSRPLLPILSPSAAFADTPLSISVHPTASTTPSRNLLVAPDRLPLAAMPRASHAAPLRNTPNGTSSSVFTAAFGERVRFSQVEGQWRATLQRNDGSSTSQRTFPVVGPADVGSFLSWLQGQDRGTSKARIHILHTTQAPYGPCVYLGKAGLLGGMPASPGQGVSQASCTTLQEEWLPGPTMRLSSDQTRTEVCHIPPGYRYKGYRIKEGSVIQRASCTIRYVAANSREEISKLEGYNDSSALEGKLSAGVAEVVPLGTLEGGVQSARVQGHLGSHRSSFTHSALVLYGSTKRNKMFRKESRLALDLEILVTPDPAFLSSFSDDSASQAAGGTTANGASASYSSAFSDSKPSDSKPAGQPLHPPAPGPMFTSFSDSGGQTAGGTTANGASASYSSAFSDSKPAAQPPRPATPVSTPSSSVFSDSKPAAQSIPVNPTPGPAPFEEPDIDLGQDSVLQELLRRKLEDPACVLSDTESIALLTYCVAAGAGNAKQIAGKGSVIVIGNTGAGKSTFVNYLLGCEMIEKTPEELGIEGIEEVVVVKSKAEGGPCDEIMPIGHAKTSKTFMPQIAVDTDASSLAYCDCPGFLDNRGAEINIANAVNIKRVLQEAEYVKVLILINYHSLLADRGRGLTDMLRICTQLFGSEANLARCQDALLLGVTKVPNSRNLDKLKRWLAKDTPKIMETMSQRLFLYDPLDRGGPDFWSRSQCAKELASLRGIPQSESCKMFQTVLTYDDEQKLEEIVDKQSKALRKALHSGSYVVVGKCWQDLQQLGVIDNVRVERMLHRLQLRLQHDTSKRVAEFRDCVVRYHFDEAHRHLSTLGAISRCFDAGYLELDLNELERYGVFFQRRRDEEIAVAQRHEEERKRYATETKRLLAVIEQQGREMEGRLSTLVSEHAKETSKLRAEMIHRGADYDEQIAKLRAENTEVLRQQAEALSLNQTLNAEERAKLEASQAQQRRAYEEKLAAAEREKALFRQEYDALLAQQQQAQRQSEAAIKEQISQLAAQKEEKEALLAKASTPAIAFGAKEWKDYFGDVGPAPALPSDIDAVLGSPCPFWPGKKVRDTHLLVLIPARVDGAPFTLNLLGELIQHPKNGGHETQYRRYDSDVKTQFGKKSPGRSYWLLMTSDVLEGSRSKSYADQKDLVAQCAKETQQPYELPGVLEAATAVLLHHARTGERLLENNPWTFTRCRELVNGNPTVVGGFASSGLIVDDDSGGYDDSVSGVACSRKF